MSIQVAEALSGALEGIEYAYYLGDGEVAELAEKVTEYLNAYLHINFVDKLTEVIKKGIFGYSTDDVAQWAFSIGTLLDTCTKVSKGYKHAHCWVHIPTVGRHAYKGGPGFEIPNFTAERSWGNPADVAVGYCLFGTYSKCYDANAI